MMGLYLLDYGAGNVQSLANSLSKLGYTYSWISTPDDFDSATVSSPNFSFILPLIYNRFSSFLV
jgi:imidazoleglycerol phosphate synthase glutamine amidotransferase subunit HisH